MEEATATQINEHIAIVSPDGHPADFRQGAKAWWFNFLS
jgi:hypothetical protein